jgi:hypothetical protein
MQDNNQRIPPLLTTVVITDCVTIPNNAFSGCSGITRITLPDTLTTIGDFAFSSCTGLTSMVIPDSVQSMGRGLFASSTSLAEVTLPFVGRTPTDTIKTKLNYLFEDNFNDNPDVVPSLQKVVLTGSVGNNAFRDCVDIAEIVVGDGAMSIGNNAFRGCTSLRSVTVGSNVTSIGDGAFMGCVELEELTLPEGVTTVGAGASFGCTALVTVYLPESITAIYVDVFSACINLETIYFAGTQAQWDAIVGLENIPSGVTVVFEYFRD